MYVDARDYQWENTRYVIKQFRKKALNIADWAMIIFMVAVTISTFQSDYFYESFGEMKEDIQECFLILLYFVSFLSLPDA
ncbi:MAG: hypothetical protein ACLTW9_11930 [Enterocloster sp.]